MRPWTPVDFGAPGVLWTAAQLETILAPFADEETADWAAFRGGLPVMIPCGGEGAHGRGADAVESTSGGNVYLASAEIFPDAASAAAEFQRLSDLVAGCGPYDQVSAADGSVLARCDAPHVANLGPVLRYEDDCDDGEWSYAFAFFQAGNTVIAMAAPSIWDLSNYLPQIQQRLQYG
jgi:hypothetical protein